MKKNLGNKNWMFPMPVLMIGTYNEDGTPDVMNAAWGGITLEDEITICIDTSHKTWANIAARKAFTVAFGTADTVKACDYLGIPLHRHSRETEATHQQTGNHIAVFHYVTCVLQPSHRWL